MAKLPTKKKEKTPEEKAAELAAMMGDVSPIRLTPKAAQPAADTPSSQPSTPLASPEPAAASVTPVPAATPPVAAQLPVVASVPAPTASDRGGAKKKSTPQPAAPQPAAATAAPVAAPEETEPEEAEEPEETEEIDDETFDEPTPEPAAVPPVAVEASYDVNSLFVPTKDKKTVMFRITPAMHQYFQQIGMILGNGTSVPDVVHNILTQWKAQHGPHVQKAMQKQLRKMLKS